MISQQWILFQINYLWNFSKILFKDLTEVFAQKQTIPIELCYTSGYFLSLIKCVLLNLLKPNICMLMHILTLQFAHSESVVLADSIRQILLFSLAVLLYTAFRQIPKKAEVSVWLSHYITLILCFLNHYIVHLNLEFGINVLLKILTSPKLKVFKQTETSLSTALYFEQQNMMNYNSSLLVF